MTKHKRRSQAEWQAIIQQQSDSGLSVITFCQQQNLCSKTLYKHRRGIQIGKKTDSSSKCFIRLKKSPASNTSVLTDAPCVLHYENCRLQFDSGVDSIWVAQVIKALS